MRSINIVEPITSELTFIFSMLEGVHETRIHELLEVAFPESTVKGGPKPLTIPNYWDFVRSKVLKIIECQNDHDPGRVFLELLRRRLIHVEDLHFMMTSKAKYFRGFNPFHSWEHYEYFLDIHQVLRNYVLRTVGVKPVFQDKYKHNVEGRQFFPIYDRVYTIFGGVIAQNYTIHKMYNDLNIATRRGVFLSQRVGGGVRCVSVYQNLIS